MKIETVEQGLKRVSYLLSKLTGTLNIKHEILKDGGGDDGCGACVVIDGWIYITPFETTEEHDSILGKKKFNVIHYELAGLVHYPGVNYYPDGSGEPPSDEIEPIKECKDAYEVVREAMFLWMKNHVDSIFEGIAEQEFEEETKEIEEMADNYYYKNDLTNDKYYYKNHLTNKK